MEQTKIVCSRLECEYCEDNYICSRDVVHLTYHSILTVNNGRQEYLSCKEYKETNEEYYQKAKQIIHDMFDGKE